MTKKSVDPRLRPLRLTVIGLGLILIAGAGFLLLRPAAEPSPTEESLQILSPDDVPRVNLVDARQAYESGAAIFVDVRDESSYESGHIPGALSIPLGALPDREGELDPNAWIITYCTWPAEESSARAAQILLDDGFTRVTPILGGFRAWIQAGYPVEP